MRPSASTQNGTKVPQLFQLAALFEDFVAAGGLKRPAVKFRQNAKFVGSSLQNSFRPPPANGKCRNNEAIYDFFQLARIPLKHCCETRSSVKST